MYFLYSVITATGMLLLLPYFLIRGVRQKKYIHNLPERLGLRFPAELMPGNRVQQNVAAASARNTLWIHAVSVGEVLAAVPLARALAPAFPHRRLVVSTTTATGQAVARERMKFADAIFYFPLDWRRPVRRVFNAVRPEMVIIFETELWPNFLREARRARVPVVFVNGRISDRSFRKFSRVGLLRGFLRRMLADATMYLMQSAGDAERLERLGAPAERVLVAGNMKYDVAPPPPNAIVSWVSRGIADSGRGPLLVAGSVVAGEEAAVLAAFRAVRQRWPAALLVLAPRKPERFDDAGAIAERGGFCVVRRSALREDSAAGVGDGHGGSDCGDTDAAAGMLPGGSQPAPAGEQVSLQPAPAAPQAQASEAASYSGFSGSPSAATSGTRGEPWNVLLLDTIGELAAMYQIADAVFVGGSLEPVGGHNPVEPAVFGRAPVFGPSMENFRDMAAELIAGNAALQVRSGDELATAWNTLLANGEMRGAHGPCGTRYCRAAPGRHSGDAGAHYAIAGGGAVAALNGCADRHQEQ